MAGEWTMSRKRLHEHGRLFLRQLGAAIRDLRREQGLLQEHLAARSGVSGSRIGEIERGLVDTSVSRVWSIARGLGLTPSQVLRRWELRMRDERATEALRAELIGAIPLLRPPEVALVAHLVETLDTD